MKWYRHTHSGEHKKFSDKEFKLLDPNYWVRVEGYRPPPEEEETTGDGELVQKDAAPAE